MLKTIVLTSIEKLKEAKKKVNSNKNSNQIDNNDSKIKISRVKLLEV